MQKLILCSLWTLCFSLSIFAQNNTIQGKVTDQETQLTISKVRITANKVSKGDIAGLFFKKGNLTKDQLGIIELKQDCAFIAVPVTEAKSLVDSLNNTRLKSKKVRISIV